MITRGPQTLISEEVLDSVRELDSRRCDGVLIRLLWSAVECRTWVSVIDVPGDRVLSIEIPEGRNPLEVFRHPFAYGA